MPASPSEKSESTEKKINYKVVYPSPSHHEAIKLFVLGLSTQEQDQIWDSILDLGKSPRPHGYTYIKQLGYYRIRQGDFRIFYDIEDKEKKVKVSAVRRRSEKTYRS